MGNDSRLSIITIRPTRSDSACNLGVIYSTYLSPCRIIFCLCLNLVNNGSRMVYYLIVYTVLLVKFPKKNVLAPHQKNLDPPLTVTCIFPLRAPSRPMWKGDHQGGPCGVNFRLCNRYRACRHGRKTNQSVSG